MKIYKIAINTVFQAVRMKFALAFILFLAAVIILVPFVLKSDGTQRGMVQITLAYSLSVLNIILSLLVIFLSTTIFCTDLRDRIVFTLDTKPVHRWEIILGKWLGIVMLNAAVLVVFGGAIYGVVQYMGRPAGAVDEQDYLIMRSEILTARARSNPSADRETREFIVPFNTELSWVFEGVRPSRGEEYVTLRFKQHSAVADGDAEIGGLWVIGDLEGDYHVRALAFPEGESNEFRIPVSAVEDDGRLLIRWRNLSGARASVIFPRGDMSILYTAGTFGSNFFRSLLMIFFRLSFLTAVGLAASTFLTFPVATLLTLFVFVISLALPTIIAVFMPAAPTPAAEAAMEQHGMLLLAMRRGLAHSLQIFPNLRAYDPVPFLVDGIMIGWMHLVRLFFSTFILRSGITALIAVIIFNRRELAHMGYE